jgi:hypothetical protein
MFSFDFIKEQGIKNLHTCPFGKSHVYFWLGFNTIQRKKSFEENKIK